MPSVEQEYQLKVSLRGRRVSRTLCVLGRHTLHDLHEVLMIAFDRSDPHLYSFYVGSGPRSRSLRRARGHEYTVPSLVRPLGQNLDPDTSNAARTRLDALGLRAGQRFEYLFDFGDQWWHDIEVVGCGIATIHGKGAPPPVIRERRGASPHQYE